MKELTRAEEQVMHILWDLRRGFVRDILERFPNPRPAYNTVSTIVRILEKKGFVGYTAYGKTHEYFPLIEKNQYRSFTLSNLVSNYFGGSFENLVSFFARDRRMDAREVEEVLKNVQEELYGRDQSPTAH
jgi:BlaI family transcriptional regulator, penicillinase repressor